MSSRRRDEPMPVEHWSFAGLMVTYWCNASCASCYLACSPQRRGPDMSVEQALSLWEGLIAASPHGCRIHLSGGEPFGDWPRLIEICRRAKAAGLGPLEKVETNAFWASDPAIIRDRAAALDAAGMGKLCISADPYHQQFVPIERCRLAAATAEEVLGPGRVQVRWRDWLAGGFDTAGLSPRDRDEVFAKYAAGGRDRLTGRAAETVAVHLSCKPWREYADTNCHAAVLRSRHVHVDPGGLVMPGTCAALVLGRACAGADVAALWARLNDDYASRPVVGALARGGPSALAAEAIAAGFIPREGGYAGKCHLCWDVRRQLAGRGMHADELGPDWMYGQAGST
jgi:hypothetical protein